MQIPLNKYKNIIFDLGGVIFNIDYHLSTQAFASLDLKNFDSLFSQAKQTQLFDRYEKGLISSVEFRNELRTFYGNDLPDEKIDHCWNALLLDLPKERLDLLKKLKTSHRTFLLSNTNEIHMMAIYAYLHDIYGISDLSAYFEKVYLSYEINMRKPDQEIFQHVLNENGLLAEETLFIDDSAQHVESAKKLGIHAILLDVKEEGIVEMMSGW
ncbi:MAG: HAD family phosphatase [Bacteroidota bacterium]|nr:HAD family phosphatase [Bacteroidota bacterium]